MIHRIRPSPRLVKNNDEKVNQEVISEMKEAAQTQFGGGGTGHKNDAIVIENVDNGYIVRVVCAALEQETVMVFSHEQRSEMLHFIASCA